MRNMLFAAMACVSLGACASTDSGWGRPSSPYAANAQIAEDSGRQTETRLRSVYRSSSYNQDLSGISGYDSYLNSMSDPDVQVYSLDGPVVAAVHPMASPAARPSGDPDVVVYSLDGPVYPDSGNIAGAPTSLAPPTSLSPEISAVERQPLDIKPFTYNEQAADVPPATRVTEAEPVAPMPRMPVSSRGDAFPGANVKREIPFFMPPPEEPDAPPVTRAPRQMPLF